MKLRQELQKLGYSHSFTTEEKGAFNRPIELIDRSIESNTR